MMTYASLPMTFKTIIVTVFFLTMTAGICICILVGRKQGRAKQLLLMLGTSVMADMLLLYASVIRAERAPATIPAVSLWFEQQNVILPLLLWLAISVFLIMVVIDAVNQRKKAITPSSIKESLDQLETGLCFSQPNGLVLLTNHRMNELSHTLFGKAIQNANLFWKALVSDPPVESVMRIAAGEQPEFRLPDGTIWTFHQEMLDGAVQLTAADTTHQHQLVDELQSKHRELEEMNARIRSYGSKVDEYVIARERLETRVNLHGFLGQALLMTRHYLQYDSGDPKKIIDIWQRNIDVLRLEAEPQHQTDSMASLQNAASAIGMQVHVNGQLPENAQQRKLIAAIGAETLTNAVRHAGAKQLWIDVEETETAYVMRYTNDGTVPAGPITEGGGLSTARRKIEAAGGQMRIETNPQFVLTIIFEKGVTMDG
ncbi:MAG: hypothetical protein IKJ26_01700 [Clostridia bacterium]|nr:hypothetical protein [Clostridia bacterium]